jgi:hypothetical protein
VHKRSSSTRPIPGGLALTLPPDVPTADVAELVAREAECCPFYTFDLRVDGSHRELLISAGEGRAAAVEALLGQ